MTHPVPCPESSPTLSHMHMPSAKSIIYVPSMTLFSKQKFLFYKSKSIRQSSISTCFYQVPCVFVGSEFSGSHRRLRTPFDTFANFNRWIHMSNKEYCYAQHTYFSFFFFFYAIVRLILMLSHFIEPTIEHQTQC